MRIACDVDDIVVPLQAEWLRRYNVEYHDALTLDQVTMWDPHELSKPECGAENFYKYLGQDDLYDHIVPLEGAVAGIHSMRELGHEVIFATHCVLGMTDSKVRCLDRLGVLAQPLGFKLPEDVVVIKHKHWLQADLLIDDGGHNIAAWVQTRRRAIMLERPWNVALDLPSMFFSWIHRARDWADIINFVEALS